MSTNELQVEKAGPATAGDLAWLECKAAAPAGAAFARGTDAELDEAAVRRAEAARARRILAAVPAWTSTAVRLPTPGRFVFAYYLNDLGNGRVVRAEYAAPNTLEVGDDDPWEGCTEMDGEFYCPAGWYENNEHDGTAWLVSEAVTHWMPLPAPPAPLSTATEEA